MWVQRPSIPLHVDGAPVSTFETQLVRKLAMKGNNVHLPVLNVCETAFTRSAPLGDANSLGQLAAAKIITPAQVLPHANAATIRDRWAQWSALTARGVGKCLMGSVEGIQEAVSSTPWKQIFFVRDNLVVNDCILCLEEESAASAARWMSAANRDTEQTCILSMSCLAHSAVLGMKPIMESLDRLPSMLVKLSHVLESGRMHQVQHSCN